MRAGTLRRTGAVDRSDLPDHVWAALREAGIRYFATGGQAVNASWNPSSARTST